MFWDIIQPLKEMQFQYNKRMARQATDWKKTFAQNTPDRGPVCKIYKELLKTQRKENKQPNLKMGKISE